jgi:hypothetical protein
VQVERLFGAHLAGSFWMNRIFSASFRAGVVPGALPQAEMRSRRWRSFEIGV